MEVKNLIKWSEWSLSKIIKMKSDEQRKIVNRYVTDVKGLKFKNHK